MGTLPEESAHGSCGSFGLAAPTVTTADRIADAALRRHARVGIAESLTCGLLASELGKGHDAAEWFAGGVVAYQTDVKQHVLKVRAGVDPCSAECAEQLA